MQSNRVRRRSVLAAALAGVAVATTAAGPALAAAPTGNLAGTVRDTAGGAVADATVSVYANPSGAPAQEVRSDAQGRFRATGLKTGKYKIQIGLPGWREWAPGRVTDSELATSYQVTPRRTTVADSVVTAAGFITGRILGPDGTPAANTEVHATNINTAAQHDSVTAADGSYRIVVQPDQTFLLSYAVGRFVEYVPHTFDASGATEFTVASGQSIQVDDRAIALAGISGRLTGAAGAPAGGVTVQVTNIDTASEVETVTAADGTYDLSGQVVPGQYKVRFTIAGRSQYAHQQPDWNSAETVTLTSGTTTIVDDQLLWDPAPRN